MYRRGSPSLLFPITISTLSSTPQPQYRSPNLIIPVATGEQIVAFSFSKAALKPSSDCCVEVSSLPPPASADSMLASLAQMCGSRAAGMTPKYISLMVGKPGDTAEAYISPLQVARATEIPMNLVALKKKNLQKRGKNQPCGRTKTVTTGCITEVFQLMRNFFKTPR